MKRPLAGVLIGYAGGILLGHFCQLSPAVLWPLAIGSGGVAIGFASLRRWLIWPLLIFSGWASLVTETAPLAHDDLRNLLGQSPAAITLSGTLAETPRVKISFQKDREVERSTTRLKVASIRQSDQWQNASGRVMVETAHVPDARFFAGQSVQITGVIGPPEPPQANGLMDYPAYLANQQIHYVLKTRDTNDWTLGPAAQTTLPLTQRFIDWASQTLALGLPTVDEPLRLVWAMALGTRTVFNGEVSDPFLRAGTFHLFAIDGLRIALVSALLITLLRVARLSRAGCGFVCIPTIWFYTAATGWEPSAIRASIMMTIVILGWAMNRPGDLVNSVCAAALIILAWDPAELFAAGFQLSFLVVLIIGLMLPPINEWIDALCKFNPLVPHTVIPLRQKAGRWLLRHGLRLFALSFVAWIGSIPLSAKYFNLFSPVSPFANILAVPLGIADVMSIMGSLLCGSWLPWVSGIFNDSAWFFMVCLMRLSDLTSSWPAAYFYVPAPSWTAIAIYYAALVAGLAGAFRMDKSKFARAALFTGLAAAVCVWWWKAQALRQDGSLTLLPLNGGQVVFIDGPSRQNQLLINCGNASSVESTLKPFLRAKGVNRLPNLLLTTGDMADSGGAARVVELFGVDHLYASASHFRSAEYRTFLADFDQVRGAHNTLHYLETVAGWQVLHPGPADQWPRAADNALVLRRQLGRAAILLLADLGRDGQSSLLSRTNQNLQADIVVASLPAKQEPLCNALIAAAHPRLIVIMDAEFPITARAGKALKSRLSETGIPVIYTSEAGAVAVRSSKAGWEASSSRGKTYIFEVHSETIHQSAD